MASPPPTRLDRPTAVAFAGAFLAIALTYVAIFVVPPLITVFVDDVGLSHAEAGALMSLFLIGYAVASVFTGQLTDRFGAINVMLAGLALAAVSSVVFAATDELAVFFVSRLSVGIAIALIYAPGITFVTRLLPEEQVNRGIGIYFAGVTAGVTIAFVVTPLLEDAGTWRWPFIVAAIAGGVGAVMFWLMARPVAARVSRPPAQSKQDSVRIRDLLGNGPFLSVCAALFAGMFVAYGALTWIAPFFDEVAGFSPEQISLALGVAVALGIVATLVAGWASDLTGRPVMVAGVAFAMVGSVIVLGIVDEISFELAVVIAIIATFGATGGLVPLFALPSMVVSPQAVPSAVGIGTSAAMSGAIASTFVGGWLVGLTDGYVVPFSLYFVATVVSVAVIFPLAAATLDRGDRAS